MSSAVARSLLVLEALARKPEGCLLSELASGAQIPVSATHRLLSELVAQGYVRQAREQGVYMLTIKLASLGLGFLSKTGVVDIVQPELDRLAAVAGDLVRLGIVDGNELTFVAKAQGAQGGLRYDPDAGLSVRLSCSAAGHCWLSTMSEDEALARVYAQGFGSPEEFGPQAPMTARQLLPYLDAARKRGFSMIVEAYSPGMTAMAAPVRRDDGLVLGVVTIAGPLFRLTETRMLSLGDEIIATAKQIADSSIASHFFAERATASG